VRFDPLRPSGASPQIYLKLESLQPVGAFKIRGAAAVLAQTPPEELRRGLVTASAGSMAMSVAWLARSAGLPCTVVVPETAPEAKFRAIAGLGARVLKVTYEEWWRAFEERCYPGLEGVFVHAFDDVRVMAGNATIATEILEDLPDVDAILTPWGGGGLTCGVAAGLRAAGSDCRVYACEVAGAAPLAAALAAGAPREIDYQPSFVDAIGSHLVFPQMFERARALGAGSLVAQLNEVVAAVLQLAEGNHVIAEGAGACPVACAAQVPVGVRKVACVISGGNLSLSELTALSRPAP
jgi:threonine dehydratase